MFKLWQGDTPEWLEQCINADFEGWKLGKFVSDLQDRMNVMNLVSDNYEYLKDLWLTLASTSNFPFITPQHFGDLMIECKVREVATSANQQLFASQGIIDTQFIAARTDAGHRG